jgi:hypothetical protein
MSPDEVCREFSAKNVQKEMPRLTIRFVDESRDTILIEGEPAALEFLGKLLLSQAEYQDCGFEIGPNTAGSIFFSKESTLNIYIHRLPCNDHK